MIEETINILSEKHLLIVGKRELDRRKFVSEIITNVHFETFRFPSKMKSIDEYLDFIKKEQLYTPFYEAKSYGGNQILDFHWDWISENHCLVVMEEFNFMEERWRIGLLREYVNEIESRKKGEKKIHLIISQDSEDDLIEKLSEVIDVRENTRRTPKQVVEQNVVIIDISE